VIVVLDANALASGLVAKEGGTIASIIEAWRAGRFEVALSDHIYDELVRALAEPYFTSRVPALAIARYLSFVAERGVFTPVRTTVQGVATHPEDDLVLSAALSAAADYLVTGDVRFRQRVPSYQGVRLLSPREFLAVLAAEADEET
jgi:uncharacterized protein